MIGECIGSAYVGTRCIHGLRSWAGYRHGYTNAKSIWITRGPMEDNRGATKWFQKEGKDPQEAYGNIIDARRRGFDSHDSRGMTIKCVGECWEPPSFIFGANPRSEKCIGVVKVQNIATTTKDNSANKIRDIDGRNNTDHGVGECKLLDYSRHVVHGWGDSVEATERDLDDGLGIAQDSN